MHSEFMDMKLSDPVVNADLGDEHVEKKCCCFVPMGLYVPAGKTFTHKCPKCGRTITLHGTGAMSHARQRSDESYEQYRERIGIQ